MGSIRMIIVQQYPLMNNNILIFKTIRQFGDILMEVFASSSVRNLVHFFWTRVGMPFITCNDISGVQCAGCHTGVGYCLSVHGLTRASNRISTALHSHVFKRM